MTEKTKSITTYNAHEAPGTNWRVIGIDPAPSKKSVVCYYSGDNLSFKSFDAQQLHQFLEFCKQETSNAFLVWDAPLTGPKLLEPNTGKPYPEKNFSQRDIERFFGNSTEAYKTPKGINTLNYSGCQHWTITRAMTGLPKVGPYCQSDGLPFNHIENGKSFNKLKPPYIVETHPALAIFLLLKGGVSFDDPVWDYKNSINFPNSTSMTKEMKREKLLDALKQEIDIPAHDNVTSDDKLDALISWALGYQYLKQDQKQPKVSIIGDSRTGSMLLPYDEAIFNKFENTYMQS
ncbi:hypothetical protein [Phaeodactylibacter xiamenensis]|uniref:hypothetical protein n=1 Tax=Phaeodactylibacter xiamenensis TaxID=1524460 RepID=UPI0024A7DF20|nr:hypothetical protein [Phaeodactylibacter xiamenensis]